MTQTPHVEKHFTSTEIVRDIVIGMSDGLTVPLALAAGLTGVVAASHIVITATPFGHAENGLLRAVCFETKGTEKCTQKN